MLAVMYAAVVLRQWANLIFTHILLHGCGESEHEQQIHFNCVAMLPCCCATACQNEFARVLRVQQIDLD